MAPEVELLLNLNSFILPLLSRARTTLPLGTLRKSQNYDAQEGTKKLPYYI